MTNDILPYEVHGPDVGVVAAFANKGSAEDWIDACRGRKACYKIVGPDAIAPGEPGCPPARLAESASDPATTVEVRQEHPIPREVLERAVKRSPPIPQEVLDEDWSEDEPAITFKPYEPPSLRLSEVDESPHKCESPDGIAVIRARRGNRVYQVYSGGEIGPSIPVADPADYFVLDADPPQPKTLADVPPGVWCEDSLGIIWHKDGVHCIYDLSETAHDPPNPTLDLADYHITRVLGTPEARL